MHLEVKYTRSPVCWDPNGDGLEINDDWHLCVLERVGGGDDKTTGMPRYFMGVGYTRHRAKMGALGIARQRLNQNNLELRDTKRA